MITLFDYPDDIRKVIYTTNAIESVNSVIRKAINKRKLFPNDTSIKDDLPRYTSSITKMDNAYQELERGNESLCYRV